MKRIQEPAREPCVIYRMTAELDYQTIARDAPNWGVALFLLIEAQGVPNGCTVDIDDLAREAAKLRRAWEFQGKTLRGNYAKPRESKRVKKQKAPALRLEGALPVILPPHEYACLKGGENIG